MKSRFACSQHIVLFLVLAILMAGCLPEENAQQPASPTLPAGPSAGWLAIYFTDPLASLYGEYVSGPDKVLAGAIDSARLSVDVAAYSLNLWSIRDALISAYRRGVQVRVVMESDNMDVPEVQELIGAGIPVHGDQREGLMHDKFVVIDRYEVWTGSMNYTFGGAYHDNNNLVRMRSAQVAEDYTTEFDEMFDDGLFGPDVRPDTPNPQLVIDGTTVEIYFSPDDGVAARLLELIQGAQDDIAFLAFSFTADDLGQAIIERAASGVVVQGVMETDQVNTNAGTEYDRFLQAGLDVRLDGNEGLMHDKVIIVDRRIVITGSYNFTASAEERNDENLVIIFDATVAERYRSEFQRIFDLAQTAIPSE
jgi:phosphatidylserine/phosphatidylglycerophosphate/cardiolipin synthase-like enzyme